MSGEFTAGNRIAGFKVETSPGTYEAPIAADYNIIGHDVDSLSFDRNASRLGKPAIGNLNQQQSLSGMLTGSFNFQTHLTHSGDHTVSPALKKLLEASGLFEKTDGISGEKYFEYDGTQPCGSLSAIVSEINCGTTPNAIDTKGRGCVPNLTIEGSGVGEQISLSFEISAAYEDEVDNAAPIKAITGADDGDVEKLLGTVFTIGGQAFVIHNYTLTMNAEVSPIPDPSKNGGVARYKITGFDPILSAQVQMLDIATSDLVDSSIDDTKFTEITLTGKYWDIEITDGNIRAMPKGDADGILTNELEIEVRAFKLRQKDITIS